jgi:murein L,D-transpeptidase YcbB/YkuD
VIKRHLILGALFTLIAFAATACVGCSGLRASWAVRSFAKEAGATVAEQYVPDPKAADIAVLQLQEVIAKSTDFKPFLEQVYGADQFQHRFIVAKKPTADHKKLAQRLDSLAGEGIDPKPYRTEERKKMVADLAAAVVLLDSLQGTSLDEAESDKLTDAISDADVKDLSPTGILAFAGKPTNQGKFPALQDMVSQAKQAATIRREYSVALEILATTNFARLCQDMNIQEPVRTEMWNQSKTDMAAVFTAMTPKNPHYAKLIPQLARFRALAAKPAPAPFSSKAHAKKGSTNKELVVRYQERLKFEGYWDGPIDGVFDETFEKAVFKYQEDRQVTPDGKIERVTIERLNVPMSDRVKQIKITFDKLRHSPTRGGDFFLRVNLGAQEVEVFKDGGSTITRRHRIIIGNRIIKNKTPEFSDEIEKIVVNPPWLVPQRIIKDEMAPEFEKDPEYFKKQGYVAKLVLNEDGTLKKIAAVTQPPGRGNALGVVKILFPNKHAVYLHDTPTKYLFSRATRTYSHGCMRLQDPVDMAKYLLEQDNNPGLTEFDELLEKRVQKTIFLQKPIPIHIVYTTVTTNEAGEAVFFTDAYKREEDLMAAASPE